MDEGETVVNYTAEDYRRQAETWEAKARAEHEEVQKWRRRALEAEEKLTAAPAPGKYPPKRVYGPDEGDPLPADFELSGAMVTEGSTRYPDLDLRAEFGKFRGYYGKGTQRRANWLGVWWSWLKRAEERRLESLPGEQPEDSWAQSQGNPPF